MSVAIKSGSAQCCGARYVWLTAEEIPNMVMVIDQRKKWTYDEYLALEDDARYEILEGELIMAPASGLGHQRISGSLYVALHQHVITNQLGEVFPAPLDVVLGEYNTVQPDLVFVATAGFGILTSRCIAGAPDMVVEILSPSTFHMDRHRKKMLYEKFGVREYWLVDPANRSVEVFVLRNGTYELASYAVARGRVASEMVSGFGLDVAEIMSASGTGA